MNTENDSSKQEASSTALAGSETPVVGVGWETRHMSQSIRGALWNRALDHFTHEDGKPMTKHEAFDELLKLWRDGWERIPVCECDHFDKVKGCLGHRAESPNVAVSDRAAPGGTP